MKFNVKSWNKCLQSGIRAQIKWHKVDYELIVYITTAKKCKIFHSCNLKSIKVYRNEGKQSTKIILFCSFFSREKKKKYRSAWWKSLPSSTTPTLLLTHSLIHSILFWFSPTRLNFSHLLSLSDDFTYQEQFLWLLF